MPKFKQNQSKIWANPYFFIVFTKKTGEERKNCEKMRIDKKKMPVFPELGYICRDFCLREIAVSEWGRQNAEIILTLSINLFTIDKYARRLRVLRSPGTYATEENDHENQRKMES